jgi:hypothetical protein
MIDLKQPVKEQLLSGDVTTKVFVRFWKKGSIRSPYQMLQMPPKLNIKILGDEAITLTTSNLKEEKRQANFILAKN